MGTDSLAELPDPDGAELRDLVPRTSARVIYGILYKHRFDGITMQDVRRIAAPILAELGVAGEQEQLDRRKRDLHEHFIIKAVRRGKEVRHKLLGRRSTPRTLRGGVSQRLRYEVLQVGYCQKCGRRPPEVELVVDHIIPLNLGGTNDRENLQALCEECNAGKKDLFADYSASYGDKIRVAMAFSEPHRRIGELLKAFHPDAVPSDLLGAVASVQQFQEDWQKRTRELRAIGWDFEVEKRREKGRVRSFYRLTKAAPWPPGDIASEIRRRERAKKGNR